MLNNHIQYAKMPEDNPDVDYILGHDLMTGHKTIPFPLRQAYILTMIEVIDWLLGRVTFDQLMDKIGAVADELNKADETRQIISNN